MLRREIFLFLSPFGSHFTHAVFEMFLRSDARNYVYELDSKVILMKLLIDIITRTLTFVSSKDLPEIRQFIHFVRPSGSTVQNRRTSIRLASFFFKFV